jgi:T5orf172 domain
MPDNGRSNGWVYLMRNPSMPNRVKIGCSHTDPKERASQLSSPTGVPEPFEVIAVFETPWPREAELQAHSMLRDLRVSPNREFFDADPEDDFHLATAEDMNRFFSMVIAHAVELVARIKEKEVAARLFEETLSRQALELVSFLRDREKANFPDRAVMHLKETHTNS